MFPVRYLIAFNLFLCLTVNLTLRMNLSLAMVVMTKKGASENEEIFDWSQKLKGSVLSSFFWGYIISNLCAAVLVGKLNNKTLLLMSTLFSSIVTLCTPLLVHWGGIIPLFMARISLGLVQGFMLPSAYGIMSRWFLPEERGLLNSFVMNGMYMGTIVAFVSSGIIGNYSWTGIFYFTGTISLLWCAIWYKWGAHSPSTCTFISNNEKTMIEMALKHAVAEKKIDNIPWRLILVNKPFYAILISNMCCMWGYWIMGTQIPSFFASIFQMNATHDGLISALPYACGALIIVPLSLLSDYMTKNNITSIITCRRIFNTLTLWGQTFSFIALAYSPTSTIAIFMYTLGVTTAGLNSLGYSINQVDIGPNHVGTIMGLTNGLGTIASIFGPMSVGYIVYDINNKDLWIEAFFVAAAISFVGNIFYLIFASGEVQDFNNLEPKKPVESFENVITDKKEEIIP